MKNIRNFNATDWSAFSGAVKFQDGSDPVVSDEGFKISDLDGEFFLIGDQTEIEITDLNGDRRMTLSFDSVLHLTISPALHKYFVKSLCFFIVNDENLTLSDLNNMGFHLWF